MPEWLAAAILKVTNWATMFTSLVVRWLYSMFGDWSGWWTMLEEVQVERWSVLLAVSDVSLESAEWSGKILRIHFFKALLWLESRRRNLLNKGGHLALLRVAWAFFFFFFFMNGNTKRAQCALSRVCSPWEKEKKCNVKNKTIVKYLKRVIKKNHAIWSLRWW